MEIEKEIKQKQFRNEYHKLGVNIVYTGNWLSHKFSVALKKWDITAEQFNVLRILRGQHPKPVTVNIIIERMLNKSSNASRLVEKLRVKGLVERTVCDEDRRAVNVLISSQGLALLKEIDEDEYIFRAPLQTLSEEEARQLNFLLDKVRG